MADDAELFGSFAGADGPFGGLLKQLGVSLQAGLSQLADYHDHEVSNLQDEALLLRRQVVQLSDALQEASGRRQAEARAEEEVRLLRDKVIQLRLSLAVHNLEDDDGDAAETHTWTTLAPRVEDRDSPIARDLDSVFEKMGSGSPGMGPEELNNIAIAESVACPEDLSFGGAVLDIAISEKPCENVAWDSARTQVDPDTVDLAVQSSDTVSSSGPHKHIGARCFSEALDSEDVTLHEEEDLDDSTIYSEKGMTLNCQRWKDLVVTSLQAASTELSCLKPVWVQDQQFMLRAKRNVEEIDIFKEAVVDKKKHPPNTARRRVSDFRHACHEITQPPKIPKTMSPFLFNPQSPKRLTWTLGGMVLMLYDLIMIPMMVFDMDVPFANFMLWYSQVFWSIDIVVSFLTGVYINSELDMRFATIARMYMTSWFFPDFIITVLLWIDLLLDAGGELMRSFRYFRLLRFLRLARLAKFEQLLSDVLEFINSSAVLLCIGITKLIIYLVLLNHINACLWFYVGDQLGGAKGWSSQQDVSTRSVLYQYLCSMHWALTQFQGTSDILPGTTIMERVYAVICVLFALITLSCFLSSITNMIMQLNSLKSERTGQQRVVRSYLGKHHISANLSVRVKKYVEWKSRMQQRQSHDAQIQKFLPTQLLMDLLFEVRSPTLTHSAFFGPFIYAYPTIMRRICHDAIVNITPAPGELIFSDGEACYRMYFVESGEMIYSVPSGLRGQWYQRARSRIALDEEPEEPPTDRHAVVKDMFVSEAVLWTTWEHCGDFNVKSDSSLLALNSEHLAQVMRTSPPSHASTVIYARRFVAGLNRFGKSYTDLIDPQEVCAMITLAEDDDDEKRCASIRSSWSSHAASDDLEHVESLNIARRQNIASGFRSLM